MFSKLQQGALLMILIYMIVLARTPLCFAEGSSAMLADGQIALSQPLTIRWQYQSDRTVNLTPATDGERIYLPLAEGMLVSLRATSA